MLEDHLFCNNTVNDVSINNEHSIELLSLILAQLGSDLHG